MKKNTLLLFSLMALLIQACVTNVDNSPGPSTMYQDTRQHSPINRGDVGVESSNISQICDMMVRDLMTNKFLLNRHTLARIIIDAQYFYNDSSNILDKNLITDKLRVELMRASMGRVLFIGRHYSDMVEKERELKRDGKLQPGTSQAAAAQLGADFRLGGRMKTLDRIDPQSGNRNRYTQITMELVDLETSALIWSNIYEFSKSGSGILPVYQ